MMLPIKHAANFLNGAAFKPSDWGSKGLPILRIAQLSGKPFDNYFEGSINRGYKIENGDLLFSWSATIDAFIWDRGDAVLNQHIFKVIPKKGFNLKYLYYVIKSHAPRWADDDAHGSTMRHIKKESLSNKVWIPDLTTQRQIADFLDRETARIDLLIEKKQRLVVLLREKLESDVLRLLTKGVNVGMPMINDSKLEWTPHRPMHWKRQRLKHFFKENTDYSDTGEEVLFSLRMKAGLIPHNSVSKKEILPKQLIGYKRIDSGQIVMNRMRAAIGLFGLASSRGIVSPDYSVFDVSPSAHAAYFLRLFHTAPMKAAFRLLSKGLGTGESGFMRLNADRFGGIHVAVPSIDEQKEISALVETEISQTSRLSSLVLQSTDRLKEYRYALITAAVTGQIDVATYAQPEATTGQLDAIEKEVLE